MKRNMTRRWTCTPSGGWRSVCIHVYVVYVEGFRTATQMYMWMRRSQHVHMQGAHVQGLARPARRCPRVML